MNCFVCGDPKNHGWRYRTDCNAKSYVKDDKVYEPLDMPSNDWLVHPWEPRRQATIDKMTRGLSYP